MQLFLRRTHEEISEHNARASGKPELLRIVNVVSPRSWRFTFSFNADQSTELNISSTPALTFEEFVIIADGSIPELFNAHSLVFVSDDERAFEGEIKVARNNSIDMKIVQINNSSGILLKNYMQGPLPSSFSDNSTVTHHLYMSTWFGSEFLSREHSTKSLEWTIFGNRVEIPPCSWMKYSDSEPNFENEQNLELHDKLIRYRLVSSASLPKGFNIVHSRLGPYPQTQPIPSRITRLLKNTPIAIEINETELRYESDGEIGPISVVRTITKEIIKTTQEVLRSNEFATFQIEVKNNKLKLAAEALKRRQEKMQNRTQLYFDGKYLGSAPISENEVMVILSKLEALEALPLASFHLLEYTPQTGIDALADLQITETSMMQKLAPIELEFHFESFIRHGHPIEQVALIVCWDFHNESIVNRLQLDRMKEWFYKYTTDDGSCPVLVLSKLAGIVQKNDK